jgi:phage gp36-like protein
MANFCTLDDLVERFPEQLALLAADETTGIRDDVRVERACRDASAEIRGILFARYASDDLMRMDEASAEILRVYAIDIVLYRISVAFSRTSETLKERYDASIARLTAIAAGKGGLIILGAGSVGDDADVGAISPGGVVIDAPERMFTRDRLRSF